MFQLDEQFVWNRSDQRVVVKAVVPVPGSGAGVILRQNTMFGEPAVTRFISVTSLREVTRKQQPRRRIQRVLVQMTLVELFVVAEVQFADCFKSRMNSRSRTVLSCQVRALTT